MDTPLEIKKIVWFSLSTHWNNIFRNQKKRSTSWVLSDPSSLTRAPKPGFRRHGRGPISKALHKKTISSVNSFSLQERWCLMLPGHKAKHQYKIKKFFAVYKNLGQKVFSRAECATQPESLDWSWVSCEIRTQWWVWHVVLKLGWAAPDDYLFPINR